ncbi:MAG: radical SAM family heme chaperone HemW [Suilimivivens sp.]
MKTDYRPLSIYIHIPFCVKKCLYCDFLSAPADVMLKERYVKCLIKEIRQEAAGYADYEVQTVFVGGGTPSLLTVEWLQEILEAVYTYYRMSDEPEITIEVNPGTVTVQKLKAYHDMGINRLSIGLQSAVNEELQLLGRIHTFEEFLFTYENAVKSGFNNINIDLMSAIPGQTVASFRETLARILALDPPPAHISAYSLIIEEGTPFYENTPELPDEETDRLLYKITDDTLKKYGYHRYEISNYALDGYECRHNKVYWKRGEYAGFGIGAASLVDNTRYSNIRDIDSYISRFEGDGCRQKADRIKTENSVKENFEVLSDKEQMEEFMFLGLRLIRGVMLDEFKGAFGKSVDDVYPGLILRLEQQGLLICDYNDKGERERVRLSELGLDVSNRVMAEFLLD